MSASSDVSCGASAGVDGDENEMVDLDTIRNRPLVSSGRSLNDRNFSPRLSSVELSDSIARPDPNPRPSNTSSAGDRTLKVETTTNTSQSNKLAMRERLRHGAHNKELPRMPFLQRPMEGDGSPWLAEEDHAAEWLNLFYDLAVVAVLTVFSSTHEINQPSAIPIFFSYYTIISWVWTSQTHYDIRYQAEDGFHRLSKAVEIMSFIYMGAASGNWNPGMIRNDSGHLSQLTAEVASDHQSANESFTTVLSAFAASRGFLAFQYLMCARNGRRFGRTVSFQLVSVGSLAISSLLTIIAVVIPAHSHGAVIAKIILFYLAISVEILAMWSTVKRSGPNYTNTQAVGDRYGALTLIILGEGFISVTRSFNAALSGLSQSNSNTYAQVFLVILIMFLLFSFLLSRFRPEDVVHHRRIVIWEAIHFPMHFNLLLLIAAMVNTTVLLSFAHGSKQVADHFIKAMQAIGNGSDVNQADQSFLINNLDRLNLIPNYREEISILQNLATQQNPTEDRTILGYQYFGQIMTEVTRSYGIELEYGQVEDLARLYAMNSTISGNATLQQSRHSEATDLVHTIIEEPSLRTLSGILWLFPTAGIALIFSSLRSMLWYRYNGPAHWIVHGFQLCLGFILALLGLLDIGGRDVDVFARSTRGELQGVNPMYWLVNTRTPLVIVVCVYLLAYLGSILVVGQIQERRKKEWTNDKRTSEDRGQGQQEEEEEEESETAREVA
ncbi:hypothetical protein IAR55_006058 [Kwoniella newhampshirensis]|uniref:Low temperature requirement protein LtrA n=1 Tax=Kwoniella newhampshirensis TaxID=1651941 RepID=A0AAW0YUM4_9TREE